MLKQFRRTACLVFGASLILTAAAYGQDAGDKTAIVERFTNQIARYSGDIRQIEFRADIAFFLGLFVMLLGLAGAGGATAQANAEQNGNGGGGRQNRAKPRRPWARYAAIAAGVLVTVVTAVKEYRFPGDPKDLRKSAEQGQLIVRNLEDIKERFQAASRQDELDQLKQEFAADAAKLEKIIDKMFASNYTPSNPLDGLGFLGPVLHASSVAGPPAWINKLPPDPRFVQAVGKGEAPELRDAERAARDDGFRQLGAQVIGPANTAQVVQSTQKGAANDYAASQAEMVNRYFEFDKNKKVYRYYVWMRLSKAIADPLYLPRARLRNTVTVAVPASGTSKVTVPLKAPDPSDGSFVFTLNVGRDGAGVTLELAEIQTLEDGSLASTRWYFDVIVDGTPRISLAENRYDDSPSRNITRPGQKVTLPPLRGSSMALTVTGYKPKDFR